MNMLSAIGSLSLSLSLSLSAEHREWICATAGRDTNGKRFHDYLRDLSQKYALQL